MQDEKEIMIARRNYLEKQFIYGFITVFIWLAIHLTAGLGDFF